MLGLAGEEGFKDKISEMVPAGHQYADRAKHIQRSTTLKVGGLFQLSWAICVVINSILNLK